MHINPLFIQITFCSVPIKVAIWADNILQYCFTEKSNKELLYMQFTSRLSATAFQFFFSTREFRFLFFKYFHLDEPF